MKIYVIYSRAYTRRASFSEKQQPDKIQTEMSVSCPAFLFEGGMKHGLSERKNQADVSEIPGGCFWQCHGHIGLFHRGHGNGRAVPRTAGNGALAVVAPVWNIIYSLGLLMGIGGSVIFSTKRGSEKHDGSENQYFTSSVIGAVILSILAWIVVICFERPILTFFGAAEGDTVRGHF